MANKTLISSKIFIFVLAVLLLFLANLKYAQYKTQKLITQEKESLTKQADALEKDNKNLSDSLSYLNSQNYKELTARQQLSLKKEGETVYNFAQADNSQSNQNQQELKLSNPGKWWKFFFKSN